MKDVSSDFGIWVASGTTAPLPATLTNLVPAAWLANLKRLPSSASDGPPGNLSEKPR